ncbi:hypothetical protein FQA47_024454 [Oryzias melastigma]|uniref:Uncharacterized protein n=1 Tax=Oryzias melastigma TaxID=30732 RepID=A0A834KXN1_ORYME|nr:hypothetical protein FQA47_024454 [Oryzias melastigma]
MTVKLKDVRFRFSSFTVIYKYRSPPEIYIKSGMFLGDKRRGGVRYGSLEVALAEEGTADDTPSEIPFLLTQDGVS